MTSSRILRDSEPGREPGRETTILPFSLAQLSRCDSRPDTLYYGTWLESTFMLVEDLS